MNSLFRFGPCALAGTLLRLASAVACHCPARGASSGTAVSDQRPCGQPNGRSQANARRLQRRQLQGRLRGLPQAGPRPARRSAPGGRRPEHGRRSASSGSTGSTRSTPCWKTSIKVHKENWRLLWAAAQHYMNIPHQGFIVAGKFYRGKHRGGGKVVNADRARPRPRPATDGPGHAAGHEGRQPRRGGQLPAVAGRHAAEQPRLQRGVAAAIPDRPDGAARLRGRLGLLSRRPPARRSTPTASRSSTTCPRASRRPRPTASAGGGASSRRSSSTRSGSTRCGCSSPSSCCNQFGVQTMAEYGWRFGRMETDDTQEGRERHLRPAHAGRGRDDRPAGHRHQAVQAARRVQLHQDLPADRRRAEDRLRPSRRWSSWPRSSRTAGSIPRRPSTGGGC